MGRCGASRTRWSAPTRTCTARPRCDCCTRILHPRTSPPACIPPASSLAETHAPVASLPQALLHRERAQQEARNRKVLEVLAAKDEAMSALEARNDELAREAATARSEMADLATKLDAAEARTGDLLRAKVDLEAQVERLGRDTAEAQAGLVGRVAELQGELEAARSRKAWAGRGDEEEQVMRTGRFLGPAGMPRRSLGFPGKRAFRRGVSSAGSEGRRGGQ